MGKVRSKPRLEKKRGRNRDKADLNQTWRAYCCSSPELEGKNREGELKKNGASDPRAQAQNVHAKGKEALLHPTACLNQIFLRPLINSQTPHWKMNANWSDINPEFAKKGRSKLESRVKSVRIKRRDLKLDLGLWSMDLREALWIQRKRMQAREERIIVACGVYAI